MWYRPQLHFTKLREGGATLTLVTGVVYNIILSIVVVWVTISKTQITKEITLNQIISDMGEV